MEVLVQFVEVFLLLLVVVGTYLPEPVVMGWGTRKRKVFAAVYLLAMLTLLVMALVSAYHLYLGTRT